MDYKSCIKYIKSLGKFTYKAGLSRMEKLMTALNDPQNTFDSIHIAGTNGKGSVAAMCAATLAEAGYKTGLFISPDIISFRERIQINGDYISEADLCRLSQKIIDLDIALNQFEFITALAFLYFAEQNVEIAVVETGMGGALDATNILNRKSAAVITHIALDHTAVLGNTVAEIARQKCGIIKNCPVICDYDQPPEAMKIINSSTQNLFLPDASEISDSKCDIFGNEFEYKGIIYKTTLSGEHQIKNAVLAIETLKNCNLKIDEAAIKRGLKTAFMPARMQVISKNPLVVLDGAHNVSGAEALSKVVKRYKNFGVVAAVMKDKDYQKVLSAVLPLASFAVCTEIPQNERCLKAQELFECAERQCKDVRIVKDPLSAVVKAVEISNGAPVFVFGSLYLAEHIFSVFDNFPENFTF